MSSQLSGQVDIMKEFRKYGDEKKLARDKPQRDPKCSCKGDHDK